MYRVISRALALSALIPACAQAQYVQTQGGYLVSQSSQPRSYPAAAAAPPPARYATARGSLGGGLLEAIFGGGESAPQAAGGAPAQPSLDPRFEKQVVPYRGAEKAGTIVIDTPNHFLYLVQEDGSAMRYGVGVGKPGFTWAGVKEISNKRQWPDWTPPPEMLARRPDLPRHMEGGPENPLGARALYLGSTLYRIHGSNEPWTIGTNVSSGCIRMRNEDVTDLYDRVKLGTRVVVM